MANTSITYSLPTAFWCCGLSLAAIAPLGSLGANAPAIAALWLAAFASLIWLYTGTVHQDGPRLFWPILALGLILRGIFFLQLDVSNDINRYVWEGWLQLQGVNPFAFAPDHPALIPLRDGPMATIWPEINHKDWSAVYPPLAQLLFRATAAISPTILGFKTLILGFELLTLAGVALLVRRRGMPDAAVALYALNPLILFYFAGEAHLDAIMAGFLTAALLCFAREKSGWDRWGFLLLGLAGMAKYLAFALLPFFLTRRNWRMALLSLLPLLGYLPFLDAGLNLLGPVGKFGAVMHYNDALPAILRLVFGGLGTPVLLAFLAGSLLAIWLAVQDRLRSAFLAAMVVLFCMPTLHPWYLLFGIILLPLFPSRVVMALAMVQCWTFAVQHVEYYTGVFQELYWLKGVAYVPVAIFLARAIWRSDALTPLRRYASPTSLSIILPVLNEEKRLRPCLEAIQDATAELHEHHHVQVEVLVADGGSFDDTLDIAREFRCTPIYAQPGRGPQIAAGAAAAKGDLLLILHADCLLNPTALRRLMRTAAVRPEVAAGCLGMRFTSRREGLWLIEALNALRAGSTSIPFGDQGQWFRRPALDAMGGVPQLLLMEDVELALKAKELGPFHTPPPLAWGDVMTMLRGKPPHPDTNGTETPDAAGPGVVVSHRRWQENGLRNGARVILREFFRYLTERRLGIVQADDPQAAGYYQRYYGKPPPSNEHW